MFVLLPGNDEPDLPIVFNYEKYKSKFHEYRYSQEYEHDPLSDSNADKKIIFDTNRITTPLKGRGIAYSA